MPSLAEQISSGPRQAILVLWTAVAFVLLICCANLANLTLARAVHRSREFAIRQAVGAGRWQLLRQVLIESTLLSLAGGVVGLLVAGWGIDLLSASVPALMLPMGGLSLNFRVLLFTMALAIAIGMVFGFLPAIRTLRTQAADSLLEGGRAMAGGRSRNRTASALVVGEVTLAVTLLGGTGLLLTALMRMQNTELGFDPRQVLTAEIAAKGEKYTDPVGTVLVIEDILRRLNGSPDAVAAAAVNLPPMTNTVSRAFSTDGKSAITKGRPPMADYVVATAAYAEVMRIPVLRGRFVSDDDRGNGALVAVVNQRFADREWPGQDPLGREVSLYVGAGQLGPPRTVVGVVANVRHSGPAADPNPAIYLPFAQDPQASLYLPVRTKGSPARFAPHCIPW